MAVAERLGSHQHAGAGKPPGGQERLHRVRVPQERRGRRRRPRLQEHAAPVGKCEPKGRADAELKGVHAREAVAAHERAAVLVDTRRDRVPVVCAED